MIRNNAARTVVWGIAVGGVLGAGCEVVDESEILVSDLSFLDQCEANGPSVESNIAARRINFEALNSDTNASASGCGLSGLQGPDGVFLFDSPQEAEWRIVAVPTGDVDIALYINDTCDASDCLAARNRCGAGLPESLAFVAPTLQNTEAALEDRRFSLVVDMLTPYAGNVDVTMFRPLQDGIEQIGEACDDGNLLAGDGCDLQQRLELFLEGSGSRVSEIEPNDDYQLANRLRGGALGTSTVNLPDGDMNITGTIGGCDDDVFLVSMEEGKSLSVSLDGNTGDQARVSFFSIDRRNDRVDWGSRTGTSLTATLDAAAPPGEYYVQIGLVEETMEPVPYNALLQIADVPAS